MDVIYHIHVDVNVNVNNHEAVSHRRHTQRKDWSRNNVSLFSKLLIGTNSSDCRKHTCELECACAHGR